MKSIKSLLLIIIFIFILSGCAKANIVMDIDSRGNLTLTNNLLVDNGEYESTIDVLKIDNENFSYNNYTIEKITESSQTGYKISKVLGRINFLSANNGDSIELSKYATSTFEENKLFTSKNRLLVYKYSAYFTIDLTDIDKAASYLPIVNTVSFNYNNDISNIKRMSTMSTSDSILYNSEIDTTFELNSKLKVGKNNATKKSNGSYIWVLEYGKVNVIEFDIYKPNMSFIIIFSTLIIIGLFAYILISSRNKKLNIYNKVSVRESLDLEFRNEKRSEYRDIKYRSKHKEVDQERLSSITGINDRLSNVNGNINAYSNVTTLDKLKEAITGDNKKKDIVPLSEQVDPKFKLIDENELRKNSDNKFNVDDKRNEK